MCRKRLCLMIFFEGQGRPWADLLAVFGAFHYLCMKNQNEMNVIEIASADDGRVSVFSRLTEAQLRNRLHPEEALFIAESPKVILVALRAGYVPVKLLCERRHIEGDARELLDIIEHMRQEGKVADDFTVYTGARDVLARLTGYKLTRGVLCAFRRPAQPSAEAVCKGASRVVVIDNVVDTTNIGAIFRSAAALGIDAVLLTRDSCDPLNRRAIRVSMGNVFLVPWAWTDGVEELKALGFKTAAMALTDDSVGLDDERLLAEPRLAIVMGTEGDGLPLKVVHAADYVVKIPMAHGVDSLNVAAASAVAFWALRKK